MRQVLVTIPGVGLTIHSFSVLFLAACLGALGITARRARREGLDPADVYDLGFWLYPGGLIGARLFYIVSHPETVRSLGDVVRIWRGGIVFYGCIAGGLIGSLIFWRRRRFPLRAMCDAVAPALALGAGLGRLGCFLNGCCYGAVSRVPWAVTFPARSFPWAHHVRLGLIEPTAARSLPVHPTQLYDALGDFAILGLLAAFYPRRRRDGEVMALLMVTYPALRFGVELLRDDEVAIVGGLGSAQLISLGVMLAGLVFWAALARSPRVRHADGAAPRPLPAGPHRPLVATAEARR